MWKRTLTAAVVAAMAGACEDTSTNSSSVRPSGNGSTAPLTRAPAPALVDTGFLRAASSINQLEIELAKMASKESEAVEIRTLADMIGRDHTDSNDRLKAIAESMKVEYPTEVLTEHKDMRNRLSKFKKADFDREYVMALVEGHRAAIEVYQKESSAGENEAIKRFAQAQLPTLRMHLEKAEAVQRLMAAPPLVPPVATAPSPVEPPVTPPVQPPAEPMPAPTG